MSTYALVKQPTESETFELPAGGVLAVGETISSVDNVVISARGLVAEVSPLLNGPVLFSGQTIQVPLFSGTDGEDYLITVTFTDSNGGSHELEAELHVEDLSWAIPDGEGHSYISPREYVTRYSYEEALDLTDNMNVGRISKTVMNAVLVRAAAEIDAYLAQRYQVPVVPVPEVLKGYAGDLAREYLHRDAASELITSRASQARKDLINLAKGVTVLPGAPEKPVGTSAAPQFVGPTRLFSSDSLKGL